MKRLPTTDLYFLNSCGRAIRHWWRDGPLTAQGANCFESKDATLLVRQEAPDIVTSVLKSAARRRIYLIDDDVAAAAADPSLPGHYRQRLEILEREIHGPMVRAADTLVVSCEALAARFPDHPDVRVLDPVWHLPPAPLDHYAVLAKGGPVRAIHLGTGSHGAGLDFLAPVVGDLLDRFPRFDFTYVGAEPALGALDDHPRVHRRKPQRWARYRRSVGGMRYHLGLYPLIDTPFNRTRSRNKILEHGVVGAVGVYAADWPLAALLGEGAVRAGPSTDDWIAAIAAVLENPVALAARAESARRVLVDLNDPAPQRRFWSGLLGVEI